MRLDTSMSYVKVRQLKKRMRSHQLFRLDKDLSTQAYAPNMR